MQPSCHPCIDKIFSWLQEEVSINIVNEIENCLLLRSVKVIVYGLPLEDVASYRSKMIHLVEVRCIIFQRTFVGVTLAEIGIHVLTVSYLLIIQILLTIPRLVYIQ